MDNESILRTGKKRKRNIVSGSNWSNEELKFFKIDIENIKNFEDFFNEKPSDTFTNEIKEILDYDLSSVDVFENISWKSIKSKQLLRYIKDIQAVTKTHVNEESSVDDFAKTLLQLFDYDYADLSIRTREEIDLEMCGGKTSAKPDLCIEKSNYMIKLLVQEDKSYNVANDKNYKGENPEAQVIAEAIAAFQVNIKLKNRFDIEIEKSQLIPCITMLGTYPTFYLINVTQELAECVKNGEEPNNITKVKKYKIPIHNPSIGDIMLSQKYKLKIFQCYSSFKKFIISE
jgi:hypothetical protein